MIDGHAWALCVDQSSARSLKPRDLPQKGTCFCPRVRKETLCAQRFELDLAMQTRKKQPLECRDGRGQNRDFAAFAKHVMESLAK